MREEGGREGLRQGGKEGGGRKEGGREGGRVHALTVIIVEQFHGHHDIV